MKKIIFCTTALVSLFAGTVFAEEAGKVSVKVNGAINVEAGMRNQKTESLESDRPLSQNNKNFVLTNSARASVSASTQTDSGIKVGGVVGLAVTSSQKTGKDSATTDNTYIFTEGSFGRLEVGSNHSASKVMNLTAGSFARGSGGGAGGDWENFYSFGKDQPSDRFYTSTSITIDGDSSKLTSNDVKIASSERTNKFTYYTPVFAGFQLGLSYIPDTVVLGNGNTVSTVNTTVNSKDMLTGGISYKNTFDKFGVNFSIVGTTAKRPSGIFTAAAVGGNGTTYMLNKSKTLKAFGVGGNVSYSGFTVGGSYAEINKSSYETDTGLFQGKTYKVGDDNYNAVTPLSNTKFWTSGIAYAQGAYGVSLNYYDSKYYNKNKVKAIGFSADYQVAPGISPFFEANWIENKVYDSQSKGYTKNKGQVYIVGTSLTF